MFAQVLDELLARQAPEEPAAPVPPAIPVDLVGLLDEAVGAPSRRVGDIAAEYLFEAMRDQVETEVVEVLDTVVVTAPPSIDPDDIALELGLTGDAPPPRELDRLRRDFAFTNHPDRVAPEDRERAMIRMQVANSLIDAAKLRR